MSSVLEVSSSGVTNRIDLFSKVETNWAKRSTCCFKELNSEEAKEINEVYINSSKETVDLDLDLSISKILFLLFNDYLLYTNLRQHESVIDHPPHEKRVGSYGGQAYVVVQFVSPLLPTHFLQDVEGMQFVWGTLGRRTLFWIARKNLASSSPINARQLDIVWRNREQTNWIELNGDERRIE